MYDALDEAHILSISMPLYFSAPPGPLKLFIDRTQVLWESARRGERRRKNPGTGVLICTGGARYRNMFHPSVTIIRHFFNSSGFEYNRRNFLLYAGMEGFTGSTVPAKYLSRARNYGTACRERLELKFRGIVPIALKALDHRYRSPSESLLLVNIPAHTFDNIWWMPV
jgi:hypothetical protein